MKANVCVALVVGIWGLVSGGCSDDAEPIVTPDAEVSPVDVDSDVGDIGVPDTGAEVSPDAVETTDGAGSPDAADMVDVSDHVDEPDLVEEVVTTRCPETPCEHGELCSDGVCVCDPTPVSYRDDIAPKLSAGCGPGCHVYNGSIASGSAGLNLARSFSYQELVEVRTFQCGDDRVRVAKGDVGASYLIDKMLGRQMCAGVRMPKGRSLWSASDMALVGRWICQGAEDN